MNKKAKQTKMQRQIHRKLLLSDDEVAITTSRRTDSGRIVGE